MNESTSQAVSNFRAFTAVYVAVHLLFWVPAILSFTAASADDADAYRRMAESCLLWHLILIPGFTFCLVSGIAFWNLRNNSPSPSLHWRYLFVIACCATLSWSYVAEALSGL